MCICGLKIKAKDGWSDRYVSWLKIKRGTYKSCLGHSFNGPPKHPMEEEQFVFLWGFRLFIQTALCWIWQMRQRAPEAAGGPIDTQHAFCQCVDHLIGGRTKITHVLLWYLWPCDWQRSRVDWGINNWGNKGWANVSVICLTPCFQGDKLTCGWSA